MGSYFFISATFVILFALGCLYNIYRNEVRYKKKIEEITNSKDYWAKSKCEDAQEKHQKAIKNRWWKFAIWVVCMGIFAFGINYIFIPTISYNTPAGYLESIALYIALSIAFSYDDDKEWVPSFFILPTAVTVAIGIVALVYSWDYFHDTTKQQMLEVEVVNDTVMSEMISPIPEEKMCVVDPIVARRAINTLMGDLKNTYKADKLTKQSFTGKFTATDFNGKEIQVDYKDQIIYVAAFEHKDFFTWWKKPYSDGYAIVNASNEKEAFLVHKVNGVPLNMRYMQGAFFAYNMERHIKSNGYQNFILDDMNIELDENGMPFAPVTLLKNTIACGTPVVDGIALLDVQSGEIFRHSVEDAPDFVNMVYPEDMVYERLFWWGEYVNGYFNPSNTKRWRACEGMDVVQTNDGCYFYVGIQGKQDPYGTEGYMLINTRNGKAKFFERKGISEQEAARVLIANNDLNVAISQGVYALSEPIFYNIEGLKTYFSTYISVSDVMVAYYAFCSTENKDIWGYGDTMEKAKASYIRSYYESLQAENDAESKAKRISKEITFTGEIAEKVQEGNLYYFRFKGIENKTFYAYSMLKPEVRWKATKVKITYNETNLNMIPIGKYETVE